MTAVVALDAGTTGVRALSLDETGRICDQAYRSLAQREPHPGWTEQDPVDLWARAVAVLAEVAQRLAERGERVAALGIANQRETSLAWDRRTGQPLSAAIGWQDRRTASRCEDLVATGIAPTVRERTGLVVDPYFSATKFEWLLRDGGVRASGDLALGTVDAWLVWHLTAGGTFATDVTNASRTMLFDIGARRWTPDLFEVFGVPGHAMPEVHPSCGRFGEVRGELASAAPSLAGVPLAAIAGDQHAALFGQACHAPGLAKATVGTGTFVLANAGAERPGPADGLVTTIAWDLGEHAAPGERIAYALEGSDFAAGAALDWLREDLGIASSPADLAALAASTPDTAGLVAVPALAGLGSPWWDPRARGTVIGITRGSGRAQLARAVLEAVAHRIRDIADAMDTAGLPCMELRVDGGVAATTFFLGLLADQLQLPVVRPESPESTAVGVAWLAGLAEGVWESPAAVAALWRAGARVGPTLDAAWASLARDAWRRAVDRARDWAGD